MTTEARDALAAALYEANVARTLNAPIAEAILRNLPDGWTLARREDAEDGAVVEEAAIAKALTYLRRQVEVMGEDVNKGTALRDAAAATLAKVGKLGGDGGVIALDAAGNYTFEFNSPGMYRAARLSNQPSVVAIYGDEATR